MVQPEERVTQVAVLNAPFFYAQWCTEHNLARLITMPALVSLASCEASSAVRKRAPLLPAWAVCACVWPTHQHQRPNRRPALPNWAAEKPCKQKSFALHLSFCCQERRRAVHYRRRHLASKRRRGKDDRRERPRSPGLWLHGLTTCEFLQTSLHMRKASSLYVSVTFSFFLWRLICSTSRVLINCSKDMKKFWGKHC